MTKACGVETACNQLPLIQLQICSWLIRSKLTKYLTCTLGGLGAIDKGIDSMHTKPYLSWISDVHTLELFHVFKDFHNIKHDIKSDMVKGDIPYGFLCTVIYRRMDDTHYTDKEKHHLHTSIKSGEKHIDRVKGSLNI